MKNAIDALSWCRVHHGTIRFEVDGTVSIEAYGTAKRASTLSAAMTALHDVMAGRGIR